MWHYPKMQKFPKVKKTLDYSGSVVYRRGLLNDQASDVLAAPKLSVAQVISGILACSKMLPPLQTKPLFHWVPFSSQDPSVSEEHRFLPPPSQVRRR